jgi:YidC/Oxa1 family membrane protein insertase
MEKRLILAFAISFLVMIIWSYLYVPKKGQNISGTEGTQEETKQGVSESITTRATTALVPPAPEAETVVASMNPPEEKEVVIDTPLYSAIFSNKGASIKGFILKRYRATKEPDSLNIELINLKDDDKHSFSIGFDDGSNGEGERPFYSVSEESVTLADGAAPKELTFKCLRPDGVEIDQTFRFYPDRYDIDIFITINNHSGTPSKGNINAYLRNLPAQRRNFSYSFTGAALLLDDKLNEIKTKKMKEDKLLSGRIGWIAYEDDYFITAVIPEEQKEGSFIGRLSSSGIVEVVYIAPSNIVRPLEKVSSGFTLYMGPRDLELLKKTGKELDKAINFGLWNIIAKPLHFLLRYFYGFVHNYGVSIVILTVLIKIIFWPLSHKSYKSMKEMQKLQPLMAKIREKYKDDREQMQRELMGLYKTYKVNPMGGCLPILIQIPVFFALYRILANSIELRHAPFMLWITDLSAPDRLLNFSFSIPFMSPPYGIPVLTLLMGASMFVQQKMSPAPGDPSQAKVMMYLPVIFIVMFINLPSGLVLYWLTNNVISILQQYRMLKMTAQ